MAASLVSWLVLATLSATALAQLPTFAGCYSTYRPLLSQGYYKYQSSGYCNDVCKRKNDTVLGLSTGNVCWCGDELPSMASKVAKSMCNITCQGYNLEDCGGASGSTLYYTVWLTGLAANVPSYKGSTTSSATSSATSAASSSTGSGSSAGSGSFTQSAGASSTSSSTASGVAAAHGQSNHQNGDKIIAIVLGVVFGVLALALAAFIFIWLARRRRRQRREEVDRAAAAPLTAAKKPEMTAGEMPMNGHGAPIVRIQRATPTPSAVMSEPIRESSLDSSPPIPPRERPRQNSVPPRKPVPRPANEEALTALPQATRNENLSPMVGGGAESDYSRASSFQDPFYTPNEYPSQEHGFGQAEIDELRMLAAQRHSEEEPTFPIQQPDDLHLPIQSHEAAGRGTNTAVSHFQ